MLQKFFSKYGLGMHLALLAAAPLALSPFLGAAALASVVLWLSALAAVSLLTEPSYRAGEHLSLARRRVLSEIVRDPFFWFLLVALSFALFRLFNSGIALRYDPEQAVWLVGASSLGGGPASVPGAGALPAAVLTAVIVVAMGLRHGVGLKARAAFGVMGSLVAGLGGLAAATCACAQMQPFAAWLRSGFGDVPFWASSFGVWLVLGIACGVQAEAFHWRSARLPFVVGLAGNAVALLFFAPPLLALCWFVFALLVLSFALCYLSRANSAGAVARNLSLAFIGFALPVLMMMMFVPEAARAAKMDGFDLAAAFPEIYKQMSETLSRISRQIWLSHPWFGVGSGAFELHVPFLAERADWTVLPAQPKFALNGCWMILAERGIVGCMLPMVGLGMLLVTYFRRLVGAFFHLRGNDDADIFPFAVPPVAWCSVFMVPLLAGESLCSPIFLNDTLPLTVLTALALSASAFPKAKTEKGAEGQSSMTSLEN